MAWNLGVPGHTRAARPAQEIHLLAKIVAARAHQQVQFEREAFPPLEFAFLHFGQQVRGLLAAQHRSVLRSEPALVQAESEPHAGAVQNDVAIAGGDAQLPTNFSGVETEKFAHHEHAGGVLGQPCQTDFEDRPELMLGKGGFRLPQSSGCSSGRQKPLRSNRCSSKSASSAASRAKPAASTMRRRWRRWSTILFLRDGEHPGLQGGAAGKTRLAADGGGQRFLSHVFGGGRIAQLQFRETEACRGANSLESLVPQVAAMDRSRWLKSRWQRSSSFSGVEGPANASHQTG